METVTKNNLPARDEETTILYESRSAEVNEILGTMPPWITRWGITVAGLMLLIFGIATAYIKLPYTINTDITITNKPTSLQVTGQVDARFYSKIKTHQQVLISLQAFPPQEFGYLKGVVTALADTPVNNSYTITIALKDLLNTTNHHIIPQHATFKGTGEILVENRSVLNRILSSIKF